ncbi:PAAR domain-containing protein [Amycolatopsis minnesotensis]|uniref:PAAR domain-containing protein n=1 Tax=Amycolatopsis minnesotensis TaxID=337894 RepID=A0ABP5BMB1_9PSEU
MPPAARTTDRTSHVGAGATGVISGAGVPNVLIEGLPAAVLGTATSCAAPIPPPHPASGTIVSGPGAAARVFIGGRTASVQGDLTSCGSMVSSGARSVHFGPL